MVLGPLRITVADPFQSYTLWQHHAAVTLLYT